LGKNNQIGVRLPKTFSPLTQRFSRQLKRFSPQPKRWGSLPFRFSPITQSFSPITQSFSQIAQRWGRATQKSAEIIIYSDMDVAVINALDEVLHSKTSSYKIDMEVDFIAIVSLFLYNLDIGRIGKDNALKPILTGEKP
jgi:hypothetical protein